MSSDIISWKYVVMYTNKSVGEITLPMAFMQAVQCGILPYLEGEERAERYETMAGDVQDSTLVDTYRTCGTLTWFGARGINLNSIAVAFPLITVADGDKPEAYHFLGAKLNTEEETFYPMIMHITPIDGSAPLKIPMYGPLAGRTPSSETYKNFVDVNGVFVNYSQFSGISIMTTSVSAWFKERKSITDPGKK